MSEGDDARIELSTISSMNLRTEISRSGISLHHSEVDENTTKDSPPSDPHLEHNHERNHDSNHHIRKPYCVPKEDFRCVNISFRYRHNESEQAVGRARYKLNSYRSSNILAMTPPSNQMRDLKLL